MPRLTLDELGGWISDFRNREIGTTDTLHALDSSWDEDLVDTALVVITLETLGTQVYLRREIGGSPEWSITFLARDAAAPVTADKAMKLAAEVTQVAVLCRYLTERTAEHLRTAAGT